MQILKRLFHVVGAASISVLVFLIMARFSWILLIAIAPVLYSQDQTTFWDEFWNFNPSGTAIPLVYLLAFASLLVFWMVVFAIRLLISYIVTGSSGISDEDAVAIANGVTRGMGGAALGMVVGMEAGAIAQANAAAQASYQSPPPPPSC